MGASLGVSRRFPDDFLGAFKFKFATANFFWKTAVKPLTAEGECDIMRP